MKVITCVLVYNEGEKIKKVIEEFEPRKDHLVIIVNDGSTDNTQEYIEKAIQENTSGVLYHVINHERNTGIGTSIKDCLSYGARHRYDILTIIGGNGKDNAKQLHRLIDPIEKDGYDYVQGSRFLPGGSYKNLPFGRHMLIKGFTFVTFLFTGYWGTDATNGFRAYRIKHFLHPQKYNIDPFQNWLDKYEMELYIHFKHLTEDFKVKEVPVSKDYIKNLRNYSKITPVIDWWKIMKPYIYLSFGYKK